MDWWMIAPVTHVEYVEEDRWMRKPMTSVGDKEEELDVD